MVIFFPLFPSLSTVLGQMHIKRLENEGDSWDRYVLSRTTASNYHQFGWKTVIEQSFGHKTCYLLAMEHSTTVGILPLVIMKSLFFGRFLVSLPFFNYGGVVADNGHAEIKLLEAAQEIAKEERIDHIELRHIDPIGHGLRQKQHKATMILELKDTAETQWKSLDAKVRNQIRKAEKSGLSIRLGTISLLADFYRVFSRNMRDLGTPVYGQSFFGNILTAFPATTKVIVINRETGPVAAGILNIFRDTVEMPWASSIREARSVCANMLLYWEAIKFCISNGYRKFDFGRSTINGSTYKFKQQWGANPVQLNWEYWSETSKVLPNISPENSRFSLAITAWKRLPLMVANQLGPSIVRNIP